MRKKGRRKERKGGRRRERGKGGRGKDERRQESKHGQVQILH